MAPSAARPRSHVLEPIRWRLEGGLVCFRILGPHRRTPRGWRAPDAPPTRAGFIASELLGVAHCRYVVRMPALVALDARVIAEKLGENDPALFGRPGRHEMNIRIG